MCSMCLCGKKYFLPHRHIVHIGKTYVQAVVNLKTVTLIFISKRKLKQDASHLPQQNLKPVQ